MPNDLTKAELAEIERLIPRSIPEAKKKLELAQQDVDKAKTYTDLRSIERWADAMRVFWRNIEEIRQGAELVMVLAGRRAGEKANELPEARGGDRKSKNQTHPEEAFDRPPTLVEMFGSRTRGTRLKKLGSQAKSAVVNAVKAIHGAGKEATITAVIKTLAGEETAKKRAASRVATFIPAALPLAIDWYGATGTHHGQKLHCSISTPAEITTPCNPVLLRRPPCVAPLHSRYPGTVPWLVFLVLLL